MVASPTDVRNKVSEGAAVKHNSINNNNNNNTPNRNKRGVASAAVFHPMTLLFLAAAIASAMFGMGLHVRFSKALYPNRSNGSGNDLRFQSFIPSSPKSNTESTPPESSVDPINNKNGTIDATKIIADSKATQSSSSLSLEPEVVVFYNIYLPPNRNPRRQSDSNVIVQEQLRQMQQSYVANRQKDKKLTVFYNTIDASPDDLIQEINQTLCSEQVAPNLDCIHKHHFPGGTYEDGTLGKIREYCFDHPTSSVIYLHNKGSLNKKDGNDHFRRALTAAALSRPCFEAMAFGKSTSETNGKNTTIQVSCNVCGLLMSTLPFIYINGNIWHAKCEYIQRLLPPPQFATQMAATHARWKLLVQQGLLHDRIIQRGLPPWLVGGNRYAWEHWQGSHPSMSICDVAGPIRNLKRWRRGARQPFELQQGPVPEKLLDFTRQFPEPNIDALNDPEQRKRDFTLLPGFMVKFATLYNQLPSTNHWMWSHYPDADEWKRRFAPLLDVPNVTVEQVVEVLSTEDKRPV